MRVGSAGGVAIVAVVLVGCASVRPVLVISNEAPGLHVLCAAATSDGFVLGTDRGVVRITSTSISRIGPALALPGSVAESAISPTGEVVVWSTADGTVQLSDFLRERTLVAGSSHRQPVAFSGNGRFLAFGTERAVEVCSLPELAPVASLELPLRSYCRSLALSPDGRRVAYGTSGPEESSPERLHVSEVTSGKSVIATDLPVDSIPEPSRMFFRGEGELVVPRLGATVVYDLDRGTLRIDRPRHPHARSGESVRRAVADLHLISGDGALELGGVESATGIVRTLRAGRVCYVLSPSARILGIEHRGSEIHADRGSVSIYARAGNFLRMDLEWRDDPQRLGRVISPDGELEALGMNDAQFGVRDSVTAEKLWRVDADRWPANTVMAFSPDSTMVAVTLGWSGGPLWIRDARTGEIRATLREQYRPPFGTKSGAVIYPPPAITALGFSPDGRELACGCEDGSILVYAVPQ